MKLSELNFGKVQKDGEFNWLGLTAEDYHGKKVLTFLNDELIHNFFSLLNYLFSNEFEEEQDGEYEIIEDEEDDE